MLKRPFKKLNTSTVKNTQEKRKDSQFLNLIKVSLSGQKASMFNTEILLKSGLRQGCPLPILLRSTGL